MQWLSPVLLAIQVISSLGIILLVLLQQGKGADMGSSFGGGSAGSLFGASGAANFLSRTTKWAAIIFFVSTSGLAYIAHHPGSSILETGIMHGFQEAPRAPATPPAGAAVPSVPGSAPVSAPAADKASVPAAVSSAPAADASVPTVPQAPATKADAAQPAAQASDKAPADQAKP